MSGLALLAAGAATVGVVHTLLGPDHYLPFVVLGRARGWSRSKTSVITAACGLGHVASSLLLGLVGIALGVATSRLTAVESARGDVAAWMLIAVGLVYGAWGLRRALRGDRHVHLHPLPLAHAHPRPAGADHVHGRSVPSIRALTGSDGVRSPTPWALFLVFVLGPCEPLIPLLLVPAAAGSVQGVVVVALVFTAATLVAMLAAVHSLRAGVDLVPLGRLERYAHALAGATILVSGLGIQLLGW